MRISRCMWGAEKRWTMQDERLAGIIEAILFVVGEAVSRADIAAALELSDDQVDQALDALEALYHSRDRGLSIKRFGDRIQLTTKADYAPEIERVLQPIQRPSLGQSALETLSIIAYKQPVTRMEIEAIRGVGSDYAIQSLVSKRMVREVGRKDTLGRPILYGTTEQFLSHFGLRSLKELPEIPAVDEQTSFLDEDQLSDDYIQTEQTEENSRRD